MPYRLAQLNDLDETAREVEKLDRRIVARQADVRDSAQVASVVEDGLSQFGHFDIVCANAGIFQLRDGGPRVRPDVDDMISVNLTGVFRTVRAVLPSMIENGAGGSIILTSSTAGLCGYANFAHYTAAKHGVVGLMRALVNEVSQHNIRVNTVHPTSVDTDMIQNEAMYRLFNPDNPMREAFAEVFRTMNLLPVPWVEPIDVSNAVAWLASDEARYVTGSLCLSMPASSKRPADPLGSPQASNRGRARRRR